MLLREILIAGAIGAIAMVAMAQLFRWATKRQRRHAREEWEQWRRAALLTRSAPIYLPFGYGLSYHTTLGDSGMPKQAGKPMAVTFK